MPLCRTAQSHSCLNQPPYCFYMFSDEHYAGWKNFWESMDGDRDKILDFAEKSEIENPNEWYDELHKFLFDLFSGDEKLLKSASRSKFGDFLAQVVENHINDPKDKYWYFGKGLIKNDFIRVLEVAAEFSDIKQSVAYINARIPDFGSKLYGEYILSKTKQKNELISIASTLNKKAYKLELENSVDILDYLNINDYIKHANFFDETFKIIDINKNDRFIIAEDSANRECYIFDIWNINL